MRGVARGRLEHAGKHSGFGEVHLANRLAEIILGRGLDPVGTAAEIGAVEIELEDLGLGVVVLEIDGDERFLDLAAQGALGGEEHVLGELLGQRATTLNHRVVLCIGGKRAEGAHDVYAEMLEEAPVLGRERRLDHEVGNFLERHRIVAQQATLADLIAVPVEEGDAILVGQVDLALGDLEGRKGEGRDHEESADAER